MAAVVGNLGSALGRALSLFHKLVSMSYILKYVSSLLEGDDFDTF